MCRYTLFWKSFEILSLQILNLLLLFSRFTSTFHKGRWRTPLSFKSRELQKLATLLPAHCLKSKFENTSRKYRYAINKFCSWCYSQNSKLSFLPSTDVTEAMYIFVNISIHGQRLRRQWVSLSWAHSLAEYPDPWLNFLFGFAG